MNKNDLNQKSIWDAREKWLRQSCATPYVFVKRKHKVNFSANPHIDQFIHLSISLYNAESATSFEADSHVPGQQLQKVFLTHSHTAVRLHWTKSHPDPSGRCSPPLEDGVIYSHVQSF